MLRLPIAIGGRDVVVGVADSTVTTADVLTAAEAVGASAPPTGVPQTRAVGGVVDRRIVDDRIRPGDDLLRPDPCPPSAGWAVHVIAGIDAGRVIPIRQPAEPAADADNGGSRWRRRGEEERPGVEVTVGRGVDVDVRLRSNAVSTHHCTLTIVDGDVTVVDAGSRNGTVAAGRLAPVVGSATDPGGDDAAGEGALRVGFGDLIRCGPAIITVRAIDLADTPVNMRRLLDSTPTGPVPFYRSPIDHPPEPHGDIPLPPGPRDPRSGRPGLLGFLLPLAMAAGLVWWTKQWFYALFALMMPLMMLISSLDRAGRNRRIRKSSKRRYQEEIEEFVRDVELASLHETRRRREGLPDATEIVRRAATTGAALWTRRRDHPWYLALSAGIGDVRWELPVAEVPDELRDLDDLVEEWKTLRDAPVELRLGRGRTVGLAGDRRSALAHARSLVAQLATLHGPADVRIAVVSSMAHADDWDWVKWLPHVRPTFAGGRLLTIVADEQGRIEGGEVDEMLADVEGGVDLVVVV
ncbi:MAG: FHA domain-containing protein, partial [Actinomycetota bacterium]